MPDYYLNPHIFCCSSEERIIFLDSKNNNYILLDRDLTPFFLDLATRRSIFLDDSTLPADEISRKISACLTELINNKLLTKDFAQPALIPIRRYCPPTRDCTEASFQEIPKISPLHLLRFLQAFMLALFGTKLMGLKWVISRTSKHPAICPRNRAYNRLDIQEILRVYRHLRTFFFTSKDHCYFDCAVQVRFLKYFGQDARWIFGVQAEPFKAHCWVQVDTTLTSDWMCSVESMTPIIVI